MYDIIIIGGGISGLYLAYKLQKKFKILLLEKSNYLGGRIYTHNCNVDSMKCRYEVGAGRLSSNHKLLIDLIDDLGLKNKLVQIPTKKKHIHNYNTNYSQFYKISKDEKLDISFLLQIVFKKTKNYSDKYLKNVLFIELIDNILSKDAAQFLLDSYGYTAEFLVLNAYDAIRLFKNDFNLKNKFYILDGGLSQVLNCIKNRLHNVTIIKRTLVEDYRYKNNIFRVKTKNLFNNVDYTAKKVIFATHKNGLSNIPSLINNSRISKLINSVEEIPMARIYAVFKPKKKSKVWFHNIGKITTNGPIQYIIPINKQKGIIMISYPDLDRAIYWKDKNMEGQLNKKIMYEIRKMFPKLTIPNPDYLKMHFWNNGVHYYKPSMSSASVASKIIKPFKSKELYITGEAYSCRQAWIEGALETSETVIKKILSNRPKTGGLNIDFENLPLITLKEVSRHNTLNSAWTVIDGLVLDITDWIKLHPGGDIIKKSMGRDTTKEWWEIPAHSVSIVNNIFPKYVIGKLK